MRSSLDTRPLVLAVSLVLIGGTVSLGVAAGAQYSLSVDGGIDTPDETITINGQSYSVTETVRVEPGADILIQAQGPTDDQYRVNLLNQDNQIEKAENALTGSQQFTFSTDGITPGSYVVALYGADGNYKKIQPVVISGYDVDVSVTQSTTTNTETTVSLELAANQNSPELDSVQVTISNDGSVRTMTASKTGDGVYTATTSFDTTGEYRVFATARGVDTFQGEHEILGISNINTVSVTEESQQTATSSPTDQPTTTNQPTTTVQPTTSAQPTTTTAQSTTTNQPTTVQPTTSAQPTTTTAQSTTSDSGTTQTNSPTTTATSPLIAVQLLLLTLVIVGAVYRVRSR